jgi:adenylate kinase
MLVILLGPPGSGKGTQAKILEQKLKLKHLSTGDLLRTAVKEKTELGEKAQDYLRKGELVPDALMVDLIKSQMIQKKGNSGYLLDGFPRTVVQAEKLEQMLAAQGEKVDLAIKFDLPDEIILKRLSGRLVCPNCNANYNIYFSPPQDDHLCDNCRANLIKRQDDKEEVVLNRIKVYRKQTGPVETYYLKQKKLVKVEAWRRPEVILTQLESRLKEYLNG